MGLSHTKDYFAKHEVHPFHPKKLEAADAKYFPQRKQYIVGNGAVFEFDTKKFRMTKISVRACILSDRLAP